MFKRIMIANRGEIAMRIIRCCHEMGIEAVLVYSEEDAESLPVQCATQAICIGPASPALSYLNQNSLIAACKAADCDAIHPGYGFLSENADFAKSCEDEGIVFIGPSSDIIRKMGNKEAARELMIKAGVPVVPGSDGLVKNAKEAAKQAEKIGYPVLLKASAGGGGRGMRRAYSESEIEFSFNAAQAEAESAFGDGSMYMEKLIENPKHIEFQILGDRSGNVISLGERDCSMQRRNQKLIEEAPAKCLSDELRAKMTEAAVKAAKAAGYFSAGTVEFIVDHEGNFYFIEMNTRIQVEHCVTEQTVGIDLIREQIRIAQGLDLSVKQEDVIPRGHTIEVRINAESPERDFAPCPGKVGFLHLPGGMGVRVESALYEGCSISPYYDSMIAKIIVHAPGRLDAIRKMRVALQETIVDGIDTNVDFLYLLMFHPEYMLGKFDTSFLEKYSGKLIKWDKDSRKRSGQA